VLLIQLKLFSRIILQRSKWILLGIDAELALKFLAVRLGGESTKIVATVNVNVMFLATVSIFTPMIKKKKDLSEEKSWWN
jgi:hypothetical protein